MANERLLPGTKICAGIAVGLFFAGLLWFAGRSVYLYCRVAVVLQQATHANDDTPNPIESLAELGRPVVPYLADALGDRNPTIRRIAAAALGKIGPEAEEAVPALIRATDDEDTWVRHDAFLAIGRVGPSAPGSVRPAYRGIEQRR